MRYLIRSNGLLVSGGLVSLNAITPVAEGPFQRNAMYFVMKIIVHLETSEPD